MRPLATVSTLAHRHASSDLTTRCSSGKATKWRFQSIFELPVRRGNDLKSSENAQSGKHFSPFVGNKLHPPKRALAQCRTRCFGRFIVPSSVQWPLGFCDAVLQSCLKATASSNSTEVHCHKMLESSALRMYWNAMRLWIGCATRRVRAVIQPAVCSCAHVVLSLERVNSR